MRSLTFLLLIGCISGTTLVSAQENSAVQVGEAIKILSWNIKMLPRMVLRVREGQIKRARLIGDLLAKEDLDMIIFQEAFDVRARRILKRRLKKSYPYKQGPANARFFRLKTNSGILMYSRIPMEKLGTIDFTACEGEDCLAFKGALLVQSEWQGRRFQALGTHLEAGGTPEMKRSQYHEIRELVEAHKEEGVPQILAGDFNTHELGKNNFLYQIMLDTLNAIDGPISGERQYTTDELENDMNNYDPEKREAHRDRIDFILIRENGAPFRKLQRRITQYQSQWREENKDLSDHNGVLIEIGF